MNIFLWEIKSNIKSLIIWSVGLIFLVIASMQDYIIGGSESTGNMQELLESMPKAITAMFGMGNLDISTAIGYYGVVFVYVMILTGIHAIMFSTSIVGKEEIDKTSEFLLVKPISRAQVILPKLFTAFINIFAINIIARVISYLMLNSVAERSEFANELNYMMIALLIYQITFLSIGFCLGAALSRSKKAGGLGAAIIMSFYILYVLFSVSDSLDFIKYITPFEFFSASNIISSGNISVVYTVICLVVSIAAISIAFMRYSKRDIAV